MFDGAHDQFAGLVRVERVASVENLQASIDDDRTPVSTLQMYGGTAPSSEEPDARMAEQLEVQVRPPWIARDVGQLERLRVVGEVEQGEAGAVRHHDVLLDADMILLRQNELAQPVFAAQPIAQLGEAAPKG